MIKVWIDADSFPTLLKSFILEYAEKNYLEIIFVANKPIKSEKQNFKMILAENTKDSADNIIFENITEKDIAITRDILLAERLVQKNIKTINDRGTYFSKENIKKKVEERNYDFNLAQLGFSGSKEKNYGMKELKKFRECFEKTLKKIYQEN
ncbi:MAG: DUF188 domain-containing protein [Treponema sp.]|nr:DUF188 domain-containing protein [Treponema sp.]MDY5763439.1 DUF188 domain-containing protein [Treponema sp.]